MASRKQKELLVELHDKFYQNVHILTLIQPTSKEFNQVFKKDMFIKSNKVGFQQVVHYLLSVLDSEKVKTKLPSWPPWDIRQENQFRGEVLKYINELNASYPDANIPLITASHLISPGGFKFLKFIFKLSQLVLQETIKSRPHIKPETLLAINPSKQENVTVENTKKRQMIANEIKERVENIKGELEDGLKEAKIEARLMLDEQEELIEAIQGMREQIQNYEEEHVDEIDRSTDEEEIKFALEEKLNALEELKTNAEKYRSLMSFVGDGQTEIEYHKDMELPSDLSHIIRFHDQALDFSSLLEAYNVMVNRKQLELTPLDDEDVVTQTERFAALNDQFSFLIEDMEKLHSELVNFHGKLQHESEDGASSCGGYDGNGEDDGKRSPQPLKLGNSLETDLNSTSSSGVLAMPLPLSPTCSSKENILFNDCKTSSPL